VTAPKVILDDRLLIEELLVGFPKLSRPYRTTSYWFYRASRAAVAGGSGHLSGPFRELSLEHQQRGIDSLLQLPDHVLLLHAKEIVPLMARLSLRHPRLNLMNLEATASAIVSGCTIWLSMEAAAGVLPAVLDAEKIKWRTVVI
jgi:hypothetical protein